MVIIIKYWLAALVILLSAPAVFADLKVISLECSEAVFVGDSLSCQATIENQGASSENISSVTLYLDEKWAGDKIEYSNTNILPDNAVEASSTVSVEFEYIQPTLTGIKTISSISGNPALTVSNLSYPQVNVVDATQHVDIEGPSEVTSGEQFTVTSTITAQGSISGVHFNLTITGGSCTLVDNSLKNVGSITSDATKFISWTLRQGTSGTCEYAVLFIKTASAAASENPPFPVGGATASASSSVTSSATTSTGGGGGGPSDPVITTTTSSGKVQITIDQLPANTETTITIPSTENMPFNSLTINPKVKLTNIEINITTLDGRPSDISTDIAGKTSDYVQIDTNIQDSDLNSATNGFKVPTGWISGNSIDKEKVVMNRYADGKWNTLTTTKGSEDGSFVYYSSDTPGFSVFGISGQVLTTSTITAGPATTAEPVITEAPTTTQPTVPSKITSPVSGSSTVKIVLAILAVAASAGAIFFLKKK